MTNVLTSRRSACSERILQTYVLLQYAVAHVASRLTFHFYLLGLAFCKGFSKLLKYAGRDEVLARQVPLHHMLG